MTMSGTPAAPARLSFAVTVRAAFKSVFGQPRMFLKAAAVPFLLSLVFEAAYAFSPAIAGPISDLLAFDVQEWGVLDLSFGALALLPFSIFGIALTRLLLIGPRVGALPSPFLGGRTWRYFGYSLLLTFTFVFAAVAGGLGLSLLAGLTPAAGAGPTGGWIFGAAVVGLLLLFYLFIRLSLVYPAVSMDDRLGLRGSWRVTRGNSIKLFGVLVLLFLALVLIVLAGWAITGGKGEIGTTAVVVPGGPDADWKGGLLANAPQQLWHLVANFLAGGMMIGALASAYAQLTGWSGPREEILERFE
jgi:hypothetical protein